MTKNSPGAYSTLVTFTAMARLQQQMQTSTKKSLFKANNGWDLHIRFKIKKRKFEKAEEFAIRIKAVYEKIKVKLKKSQEKMRKYVDRKRSEPEEY